MQSLDRTSSLWFPSDMLPSSLSVALERRKIRHEKYAETPYLRLADDYQDLTRGTVVFGETIVYGYPHIGRILRLDPGLREHFAGTFWAEEKVDGYNVRVVRLGDRIIALTRGGFVCPFTTDRIADLLDLRIFEREPDLVLCAEVAGPETPYIVGHPPHVSEDVQLFVFDMMRVNQIRVLPRGESHALVERYGLPAVESFGRFEHAQYSAILDLVRRINEQGREGLVFKEDGPGSQRAKYVTCNSSVVDVEVTARNMLQLPPEYFTNRILRLVLFMDEVGAERVGDLDRRLGQAFLDGLFEAIEQFRRERRVYHTFRCRFRDPVNARRLLKRVKRADRRVHVVLRRLEREGNYYVLEFDKIYDGMTGLLGHLLRGGLVYD